jgi:hypothetical protein
MNRRACLARTFRGTFSAAASFTRPRASRRHLHSHTPTCLEQLSTTSQAHADLCYARKLRFEYNSRSSLLLATCLSYQEDVLSRLSFESMHSQHNYAQNERVPVIERCRSLDEGSMPLGLAQHVCSTRLQTQTEKSGQSMKMQVSLGSQPFSSLQSLDSRRLRSGSRLTARLGIEAWICSHITPPFDLPSLLCLGTTGGSASASLGPTG